MSLKSVIGDIAKYVGVPYAVGTGALILFLTCGSQEIAAAKKTDDVNFRRAYDNALLQVGDINKDGRVSIVEREALFKAVVESNGGVYVPYGMPLYTDGREIPTGVLAKWFSQHIPEPPLSRSYYYP